MTKPSSHALPPTSARRCRPAGRLTSPWSGVTEFWSRPLRALMKIATLFILALSCALHGCATYPTADAQRRQLQAQLREVVVEDGISTSEAEVIAQSYFMRFGPGCGAASRVTDGGAFWVSSAAVGVGGIPTREPIRIDKQTGRVTWSDGPAVENPKTIW